MSDSGRIIQKAAVPMITMAVLQSVISMRRVTNGIRRPPAEPPQSAMPETMDIFLRNQFPNTVVSKKPVQEPKPVAISKKAI
jgi:hypothetical protein